MLLHPSPYARALLLVAVITSALAVPGPACGARIALDAGPHFQPAAQSYLPFSDEPVSIVATDAAVPAKGGLDYTAVVRLDDPTDYLQVRFRLKRPSGKLLYQKTQVASGVAAGVRTFQFARSLEDLALKPGVYPIEVQVTADGAPAHEWTVESSLRVYDPSAAPIPVALVVKVYGPPQTDPTGRFVVDPAVETAARDGARAVADAVLDTPGVRASLALPPVLLQEWQHIAQGYELSGTGGVTAVGPDSPVAQTYGRTLARVREAAATGRLELVQVPYADPDLAGLEDIDRTRDLDAHLLRGRPVYEAALDSTPGAGAFTAYAELTEDFAVRASKRGIRYAIIDPDALRRGDDTPTAGSYRSEKMPLQALVPDRSIIESAAAGDSNALLDGVFDWSIAKKRPTAVPLAVEIGPGASNAASQVLSELQRAASEPWLRLVTAREAAALAAPAPLGLVDSLPADRKPPADLWPTIAESRRYATAYSLAAPAGDQDAAAAATDSLIAECAYWAGSDGAWSLAERAKGFAASALRRARDTFKKVSVTGENVTLSGMTGSVPFSVTNADERPLTVTIKTAGGAVRSPSSSRRTLAPGESYVRVPVDLRNAVDGRVALQVTSGDVTIASRAVTVRASYLDRLAILGAIVVVLIGMLIYISRRVRRADNRGRTSSG